MSSTPTSRWASSPACAVTGPDPIADPATLYRMAKDVQAGAMSMDQLTAWMRDWKKVLPVLRHEWEEHPQLFDPEWLWTEYEPVRQGASSRQS